MECKYFCTNYVCKTQHGDSSSNSNMADENDPNPAGGMTANAGYMDTQKNNYCIRLCLKMARTLIYNIASSNPPNGSTK